MWVNQLLPPGQVAETDRMLPVRELLSISAVCAAWIVQYRTGRRVEKKYERKLRDQPASLIVQGAIYLGI